MRWILIVALMCAVCFGADARPNILFAIADDWSRPHAGVYGDKVVKTPTFDRVAAQGMLFNQCFCVSPSCSPSRASILTGRAVHALEEGANLWGFLPAKFKVYPEILEGSGYSVGFTRKGWGPGQNGDRARNAAGKNYKTFTEFLKTVPADKPFCFWFGSHDPHRPYKVGQGEAAGMNPKDVVVPPYLPDTLAVRGDICDYYFAVQRFDTDVDSILKEIQAAGRLQNTVVIMTGDNGWPFPRCKTNLYDSGCNLPLAVSWPGVVKPGQVCNELISFLDYAPTMLEIAGEKPLPEMNGKSFLPLLQGKPYVPNEQVYFERERHANVRKGDLSYPVRAIRTRDYLYIRNLRPDLWPAGDPEKWVAVGPYGDIDGGPSKDEVIKTEKLPGDESRFYKWSCAKRPAEELYDLKKDPDQFSNVADKAEYANAKAKLRATHDAWLKETGDPRVKGETDAFDKYKYFGTEPKAK